MQCFSIFLFAITIFFKIATCDEDVGDLSDGDNDIKLSSLPSDVKTDLLTIASGGPFNFNICTSGHIPNLNKIDVLLYNRSNKDNPRVLNLTNPQGIHPHKPIYVLIHGWLSGKDGYLIKDFRNAYVDQYGENVIFIHWGKLAWFTYTTIYCNTPIMAQYIADFLCDLSDKKKIPLSNVHIIGHSTGGHFCGFIGKATQTTCGKKIGKITGLDPAGPVYQFVSESKRLAPTDAELVEVVHSAAGTFGYLGKCGTVDYYLNCGSFQPGCVIPKDIASIPETSIFLFNCPHMRPVKMWPYVLRSKKFKAKSCAACAANAPVLRSCITDPIRPHFITMGHVHVQPREEHYNVVTSPYEPYYLGCTPYPFQGCV